MRAWEKLVFRIYLNLNWEIVSDDLILARIIRQKFPTCNLNLSAKLCAF